MLLRLRTKGPIKAGIGWGVVALSWGAAVWGSMDALNVERLAGLLG